MFHDLQNLLKRFGLFSVLVESEWSCTEKKINSRNSLNRPFTTDRYSQGQADVRPSPDHVYQGRSSILDIFKSLLRYI